MCRRVNRLLCTLSVINSPFWAFVFSRIAGFLVRICFYVRSHVDSARQLETHSLTHSLACLQSHPQHVKSRNLHKNDCSWHTRNWFSLSSTLKIILLWLEVSALKGKLWTFKAAERVLVPVSIFSTELHLMRDGSDCCEQNVIVKSFEEEIFTLNLTWTWF